jgi:hypothetical protein
MMKNLQRIFELLPKHHRVIQLGNGRYAIQFWYFPAWITLSHTYTDLEEAKKWAIWHEEQDIKEKKRKQELRTRKRVVWP